ncbi:hypothetical protein AYJ08_19270 [Brevibacillus sp. SKDU10]|nr:hypothetical protein AYJ08_19270 [Brevibacillus sp. SKDU10]
MHRKLYSLGLFLNVLYNGKGTVHQTNGGDGKLSSMIIAVVVIVGIIVGCSIWAINKGYSYKNKIDDIDK